MTGYELYLKIRSYKKYKRVPLETYLESSLKPLHENIISVFKNKGFTDGHIHDFLNCIHNSHIDLEPHNLLLDEAWEIYNDWSKKNSSEVLYFEEVKKSFNFIENFCINKSISFDKYKKDYAVTHIREKKIDWAVAVYLELVDIKKIKPVEKLLLKPFISKYNSIITRLYNPKLNQLMSDLNEEMIKILETALVSK
jgi:hypothetical protein